MKTTTFTLLLFIFSATIAQPTSGLVGYFNFNNTILNTGSTTITATNNNVSFGTNRAGTANSAIQFNGSITSFLSLADNSNLDFLGDFTVSLGIMLPTLTNSQGIYDNCLNYGGYGIYFFSSDNTIRFNSKNGSVGATGLVANQWKAITVVRSGTTLKIYVNGVLGASGSESTQVPVFNFPPVVGQMYFTTQSVNGNYNPILNGSKIDEMRFYNRALTDVEIASLTPFTLPTSIQNFNVVLTNNEATLAWEITNFKRVKTFAVEQSVDGKTFTPIATVACNPNKSAYTYTDNAYASTSSSSIFYRIVEYNNDGSFTYSNTLQLLKNVKTKGLFVYPNPAKNNLNIRIDAIKNTEANVYIVDNLGKQMLQKSIYLKTGQNLFNLPINGIKAGNYWLKIIGIDCTETQQVVIE